MKFSTVEVLLVPPGTLVGASVRLATVPTPACAWKVTLEPATAPSAYAEFAAEPYPSDVGIGAEVRPPVAETVY
ncbi:MAG TPA: hypothetical protein VHX65_04720 [Pirellulales bacterium]|nr:hypothetical protein [Pirellulales bacterium]